jgi:hypothetical protein
MMAYLEERNQKLLIAVGKHGGALILEAIGQAAVNEIREYSPLLEDHFPQSQTPKNPGFYVWEGSICIDDGRSYYGEPADPDVHWEGNFRDAAADDIAAVYEKPSSVASPCAHFSND